MRHIVYAMLRFDGESDPIEFDLMEDAIEHAKKFGWAGVVQRTYTVASEEIAWRP